MANPFEIERKIARLNDLIERAQRHVAIAFGRSTHCIMGNDHEHARWARIKLNEPELSNQDDAGRALLPTWPELTQDLYSALRRTGTVLYDEDQIAPTYRGNRKLLAPLVEGDEWGRIHDMTMGDDNMTVIAALKIQDGWITELQRQKDEADRRREEQQQRAQQRREEREQEEEQDDEDESDDAAGAGDSPDEGEPGDGPEEEEASGDAGASGEPGGTEPDGEAGDAGDDPAGVGEGVGDADGASKGTAADSGSGPGPEGDSGDECPAGPGFHGDPEPNNAVEAAEAGGAHASAARAAQIALEQAQALAEALARGEDVGDQLDAVEAALEAAGALSDDAEERILAQAAFDDENGVPAGDSLKKAIKAASQDLKDQTDQLRLWGVGKADLAEMDPTEVMALMKLLRDSAELKKIADLLGYQRREVQKRKVRDRYAHGPEVRIGVEQGRKLNKMLGSQRITAALAPQVFRYKYFQNQLMQHRTRIFEVQERGDGVLLLDCSGSMSYGQPYTYNQITRATALTVVEYFQSEGRNCIVMLFDYGVREVFEFTAGMSRADLLRKKIALATHGFGGGTDFYEPLMTGLKRIQDGVGYWDKSSMVLVTDGECYLAPQQVQEIKAIQEETKVDIQTWTMPNTRADQMKEFGPVDTVQTSLEEAGKMAMTVVERMDAQWQ